MQTRPSCSVAVLAVFTALAPESAWAQCYPGSPTSCCVANLTPYCSDPYCCSIVCAQDPYCCNNRWDQLCADAAQQLCPVCGAGDCELASPTMFEAEPCGARLNDACLILEPVVQDMQLGDTVLGSLYAQESEGYVRDRDHYRVTLKEMTKLTVTVIADAPMFASIDSIACFPIARETSICPVTATYCLPAGEYLVGASIATPNGYPCGEGASYTLTVDGVPCGIGDDCVDALPAVVGANPFDTSFATTEVDAPSCGVNTAPFTRDVWFAFTAPMRGTFVFDTCPNPELFDSGLELWSACPGAGGSVIACNDNGDFCVGGSRLLHALELGQQVFVRVGGVNDAIGIKELNISYQPCGACALETPSTFALGMNPFTTSGSACELDLPSPCSADFDLRDAKFFRFTAPRTAMYSFRLCNTDFDASIAIMGICNSPYNVVACSDGGGECARGSAIEGVQLNGGQNYRIVLGGRSADSFGSGTLEIGFNDECSGATRVERGNIPFDTTWSTGQSPACPSPSMAYRDLWYRYVSVSDEPIEISTCAEDGASNQGTLIQPSVRLGSCDGELVQCTSGMCGIRFQYFYPASCGETYYIAIGGWWPEGSSSGNFALIQAGSCPPPCPADFDGNGEVDSADLGTLLSGWGGAAGDVNGDGDTDSADLGILLSAWGPCS